MILHHLFHVAKIQTIPWQYKGFSLIGKGNSLKAPVPLQRTRYDTYSNIINIEHP